MMGRRYQNFVAPGDEDISLPVPSSCWHVGRLATIPAEHWEILIEFANKKLSQDEDFLEKVSYLDGDFSNFSMEKVTKFHCILEELISILRGSEDINHEYSDEILEIHSNDEYIEMLKTILAVVDESLKLSKFFNSYTD
jgi:hypothetical protein